MNFLLELSAEEQIALANLYAFNLSNQGYNAVELAEFSAFFKLITVNLDAYVAKRAYYDFLNNPNLSNDSTSSSDLGADNSAL